MNYYMIHTHGMRKVDEKSYKAHTQYENGTPKNRDIIDWYDDGENLFFGDSTLDENSVVMQILIATGRVDIGCCLWGI